MKASTYVPTVSGDVAIYIEPIPAPEVGPPELWWVTVWWWSSRSERSALRRAIGDLPRALDAYHDYVTRARNGEWGTPREEREWDL